MNLIPEEVRWNYSSIMVKMLIGMVYKYHNHDNCRVIKAFAVVQNYLYFLTNNVQEVSWGYSDTLIILSHGYFSVLWRATDFMEGIFAL